MDRSTPVALLRAADADPAALGEDADSDAGAAPRQDAVARSGAEPAVRSRPVVAELSVASRAPAGPTLADPALPGGLRAPSAPITTTQLAADGRFTDGKLPQQAGVTMPQKIEVDIQDGEHALKVTLAQEADGLVVEVRSPREAVAQLRALEPEVDAALADSGYDLDSYDAREHGDAQGPGPDAGAHPARPSRTPAGSAAAGAPAAQAPAVSPDGQGRLLSREA